MTTTLGTETPWTDALGVCIRVGDRVRYVSWAPGIVRMSDTGDEVTVTGYARTRLITDHEGSSRPTPGMVAVMRRDGVRGLEGNLR